MYINRTIYTFIYIYINIVIYTYNHIYNVMDIHKYIHSNTYIYHHHHHHVNLPARISLTLSCHPSLLSIAPGMSSRLHPVSAQRCCIYVLAGHPTFSRPCLGVHRSMSLMSLSLLLQECPHIWFV